MKFKTTITEINNSKVISYYIDDILIAQARKYSDWFCTIKNGTPSRIRDKVKKCKSFTWSKEGLIKVIGHSNFTIGSRYTRSFTHVTPDFIDDYPDTKWGYSGSIPSKKSIIELINSKKIQP